MNRLNNLMTVVSLLVLLLALPLIAQESTITLDEAIKTALTDNREIKIAQMNVEKSQAAVNEAFGYALPTVDFSAGLSHFLAKPKMAFPDFEAMLNNATYGVLFAEDIMAYDAAKLLPMEATLQTFAQTNNFQTEARVTQILFNSAVFTGIGASYVYLNLAKANLKSTVSKTVLNVKKAFYGALLTRDLLDIARQRLANATDHLNNIAAMRSEGLVSEFNEMQAQVQVENIRPVILQLDNSYKDAVNGLKILINRDQDAVLQIEGEMVYSDDVLPLMQDLIAEAKENNLDIKTLKTKNQLDDEFTSIEKGDYWPTVALFGNYSYAGNSDDWEFNTYSSSSIGVSLSLNLFRGGRTAQKVQQSKIVSRQTQEQINNLTDYTVSRVKSKYNDLLRVKKQVDLMQTNINLAQRAYEIAEHRYKEGVGSELELKDSDVTLNQSRINYTRAVHDYVVARAELYNLVGRMEPKYYNYLKIEE